MLFGFVPLGKVLDGLFHLETTTHLLVGFVVDVLCAVVLGDETDGVVDGLGFGQGGQLLLLFLFEQALLVLSL